MDEPPSDGCNNMMCDQVEVLYILPSVCLPASPPKIYKNALESVSVYRHVHEEIYIALFKSYHYENTPIKIH